MNKQQARKWMSQALDGELSPARRRKLERWLAAHPEEQAQSADWRTVGTCIRTAANAATPLRSPAQAWAGIRATLDEDTEATGAWQWATGHRLHWAGALMLLLLVGAGLWWRGGSSSTLSTTAVAEVDRTQVEWVDTDVEAAVPMVYTDAGSGWTVIWVSFDDEQREENGHAG